MTQRRRWEGPAFAVEPGRGAPCAAVFSSPHSGRRYPEWFCAQSQLSGDALRASEDAYVDALFADAPKFGAAMIRAEFPRAFVDANRAEADLDPALIADPPRLLKRSARAAAGLGVVPRIVSEGKEIYSGKISMAEAQARIDDCHRPYHGALSDALAAARDRFGFALLIDCHSMPSEISRAAVARSGARADIVIGDRFGAACGAHFMRIALRAFREAGFSVARNDPFAGGFITERYGRPDARLHALQIEVDRGLYLDEARRAPGPGFADVRAALAQAAAALCDAARPESLPLAAE